MSDFFNDQKRQVVSGLGFLKTNDYKDIHMATLKILAKTGIFVEDQQARELYGSYGASIDEKKSIVKLPSSMVEDAIRSAPAQVMLAGRTPDRNVLLENTAKLGVKSSFDLYNKYTTVKRRLDIHIKGRGKKAERISGTTYVISTFSSSSVRFSYGPLR